ncbi:MAG: hypothetical protein JWO36_2647 [Myxococcales bacterium]|nr:hypothetical protein [Myxococcales bacterium]
MRYAGHMWRVQFIVLLAAACGGSHDSKPVRSTSTEPCQQFADKAWAVIPQVPEVAQPKISRDEFVRLCRDHQATTPGPVDPMFVCVAAAQDEAAVKVCLIEAGKRLEKKQMDEFMGPLYDDGFAPTHWEPASH